MFLNSRLIFEGFLDTWFGDGGGVAGLWNHLGYGLVVGCLEGLAFSLSFECF